MKRPTIAAIWSVSLVMALAAACGGGPEVTPSAGSPTSTRPAAASSALGTPTPTGTQQPVKPVVPPPVATQPPTAKGGKATPATSSPPPPAVSGSPTDFIAPEILGRPTGSSVAVNVAPARDLEIYFEYGAQSGTYTIKTEIARAPARQPIEVVLDRLLPNTRYYYSLRYRQPGAAEFIARPEHSFSTQRAPGSTFIFDIQGDSHPERLGKQFDPDLYRSTLLSAAADQPDFFMTIGDDFSVDNLKTVNVDTVTERYTLQREFLGLVGSSAPVFLVNGNHEQAAQYNLNGTPNSVAVWAQQARNRYYPQPAPDSFYTGDVQPVEFIGLLRDYYSWTWGEALFVVIDPYWHSPVPVDNVLGGAAKRSDMWDITLGDAQYQWLKRTLEQSTARYKFVFAHHVNGTGRGGAELAGEYEWGGKGKSGVWDFAKMRPGWELPIHRLMVKNGVTIFFQGHDHIFVRQELDGVIYQSLPEPANPFYTYENEDAYQTGTKLPNSGYVRVTVAPDAAKVEYIRCYLPKDEVSGLKSGQVAFSYTVQPAPGR